MRKRKITRSIKDRLLLELMQPFSVVTTTILIFKCKSKPNWQAFSNQSMYSVDYTQEIL